MLAHRERRLFTPEEYLAIEEKAETRSEYYRGEIFAMSGGSLEHAQLSTSLTRTIGSALLGTSCQLFGANLRLHIAKHSLFTYPDLYVVCGSPVRMPGRRDTLQDATLIIEILSPSTELYDRGEKFVFYQGLPSFREYLLVSQREVKMERYARTARGEWRSSNAGPGEKLSLKSIRCELVLDEIYLGVDLPGTDQILD